MLATAAATALSIPRLRSSGLAPAATFFRPSLRMACARTVAVVVPSPASSAVLLATLRTSWAPAFWKASSSSISLATLTPSFVMRGAPNFLSMTTLRPFGPRVTLTAFAKASAPAWSSSRASTLYFISFAMIVSVFLVGWKFFFACRFGGISGWGLSGPMVSVEIISGDYPRMASTSFWCMMRYFSPSSSTSVPEYFP